jgi:pentatricopeptide repeat protein
MSRKQQYYKLTSYFQQWRKHVRFDKASFEEVVYAYTSFDLAPKAEEIVKQMLEQGIVPARPIFQVLINAYCRRKDMISADRILTLMQSKGFTLDSTIAGILIDAYIVQSDVASITRTVNQMKQARLQPNALTFSSIIAGYCSHGMYAKAKELLVEMERVGIAPTDVTYTAALRNMADRGDGPEALELLMQMKAKAIAPVVTVVPRLVLCFGQSLPPAQGIDASKTLLDLLQACNRLDTDTIDAIIEYCSSNGKSRLASHLLAHLSSRNRTPTVEQYNRLIQSVASSGMAAAAKRILGDMKAAGIKPSSNTYSSLVLAYSPSADFKSAMELVHEMVAQGLKPNSRMFVALLSIIGRTKIADPPTASSASSASTPRPSSRLKMLQQVRSIVTTYTVPMDWRMHIALAELLIAEHQYRDAESAICEAKAAARNPEERSLVSKTTAYYERKLAAARVCRT